ncbi:MAG TPA: hypothetical protein PLK47_06765, partial [Plasticicumulans sp.]|nr:hypothetical protein [Plasticicumulans sp.]
MSKVNAIFFVRVPCNCSNPVAINRLHGSCDCRIFPVTQLPQCSMRCGRHSLAAPVARIVTARYSLSPARHCPGRRLHMPPARSAAPAGSGRQSSAPGGRIASRRPQAGRISR